MVAAVVGVAAVLTSSAASSVVAVAAMMVATAVTVSAVGMQFAGPIGPYGALANPLDLGSY